VLSLSGVGKRFGAETALTDVDMIVRPAEFVAVLGPSGCGKTTLLRIAAGALEPSEGSIENRFSRVATVYQEPRLLEWRDAIDNAAFGLKALGLPKSERRARARELLTRLGLSEADGNKRPKALSGGMNQRVAIARALAIAPDLILMDEPFSALDPGLRRRLQDLTCDEAARAGAAVLFVTHDVAEAARIATRIVVFSARPGRVIADIANAPRRDPVEVLARAAELLRIPIVAQALLQADG
jgi:NitT/TauT family transport system ATP-binding protein